MTTSCVPQSSHYSLQVINDWYDNLDDEDPFENNDDYNDRGDIVYPNYYDDDHEEPHSPLDITGTKLLLVAVFGLGGILGSLLIAIFAGLFGRKGSLLCSNAISLLGLLLMSFARVAYSFELFIIGRLLLGISAGLHSGLSPMYLIEIAPECLRGIVGSAYYASVALAVVAAYIFTLPSVMGSKGLWPFLFLFAFFPPIIQVSHDRKASTENTSRLRVSCWCFVPKVPNIST
jgi:MFS family permease